MLTQTAKHKWNAAMGYCRKYFGEEPWQIFALRSPSLAGLDGYMLIDPNSDFETRCPDG